jgi:hypothetical protein
VDCAAIFFEPSGRDIAKLLAIVFMKHGLSAMRPRGHALQTLRPATFTQVAPRFKAGRMLQEIHVNGFAAPP